MNDIDTFHQATIQGGRTYSQAFGRLLCPIGFFLTIPAANWLIGNVGTYCVPNGPCLIPVAPGITAPSGVLLIGVALVLRDLTQRYYGWLVALLAIVAGAVLSVAVAPPALALASGTAFLLSELIDFAVYTPLAKRRLFLAVLLSGIAGAIADSALFLLLAFGSLQYLLGQVIGKLYASVLFAAWLYWRRRWWWSSEDVTFTAASTGEEVARFVVKRPGKPGWADDPGIPLTPGKDYTATIIPNKKD